jgi:hypothetical protein
MSNKDEEPLGRNWTFAIICSIALGIVFGLIMISLILTRAS